jgi:ABC-type transport system involved in cytochrome c biogenesis permease subunit
MPDHEVAQGQNLPDGDRVSKQSPDLRHSPTGIASSIIGVIGLVFFGLSIFISAPASLVQSLELARLCIVPILWITGLVLAVIGLSRKKDRKLFPILGLIASILYLCPLAVTILGFVVSR